MRPAMYDDDVVTERYMMFRADSFKRRVQSKGVPDVWAVVSNIADHKTMISLAAMRRYEKED